MRYLIALILLSGCAQPVTPDQPDYRHRWRYYKPQPQANPSLRWQEETNLDNHFNYLKEKYSTRKGHEFRVSPGMYKRWVEMIDQYIEEEKAYYGDK